MLFVWLGLSTIAAAAEVKDGVTALSAQGADGAAIEVKITTVRPLPDFLFRSKYIWGGGENEPPALLVGSIDVAVGGEQVFVPLSAFSDLGSPKMASLKISANGFEVVIIGGDAGGAYDATFTFDGSWLVQRRVSSREFPDEAWEETKYSFNRN